MHVWVTSLGPIYGLLSKPIPRPHLWALVCTCPLQAPSLGPISWLHLQALFWTSLSSPVLPLHLNGLVLGPDSGINDCQLLPALKTHIPSTYAVQRSADSPTETSCMHSPLPWPLLHRVGAGATWQGKGQPGGPRGLSGHPHPRIPTRAHLFKSPFYSTVFILFLFGTP